MRIRSMKSEINARCRLSDVESEVSALEDEIRELGGDPG